MSFMAGIGTQVFESFVQRGKVIFCLQIPPLF
jgi:hypothetical protein